MTRWKIGEDGKPVYNSKSGKRVLQFVSIARADTKQWAIPGVSGSFLIPTTDQTSGFILSGWLFQGMCDPGEKISTTLKREFMEEATNCLTKNKQSKQEIEDKLHSLFENGTEVSGRNE